MAYQVTVIPIMIASPGNVLEVRNIARDAINDWTYINSLTTGVLLTPVGWETHAAPELGGRPQALIKERVLNNCDLLVAIFWTRLGTPMGDAESGSAEEIQRHIDAGKPAMVYFSSAPVAPQSLNQAEYARLEQFRV